MEPWHGLPLHYHGFDVAFSPFREDWLAVASAQHYGVVGNGALELWSRSTDAPVRWVASRVFESLYGVVSCAWSECSEAQVVGGCTDGGVKMWDMRTPDAFPVAVYAGHSDEVLGVSWSTSGRRRFVTASQDASVRLWDPERWSPDVRSKEDVSVWSVRLEGAAYEAALHPRTDDLLLAGSADRHAHVFDLRARSHTRLAHPNEVVSVDWSKYDEFELVTGCTDHGIRVWDLRRPEAPLRVLRGHRYALRRVRTSPHSRHLLLSASYDMTVCLWDRSLEDPAAAVVARGAHHREFVVGLAFSVHEDGLVASCGWDRRAFLWSLHRAWPGA